MIAFGFMTWHPNGTILLVESGKMLDHIEAKLVGIDHIKDEMLMSDWF